MNSNFVIALQGLKNSIRNFVLERDDLRVVGAGDLNLTEIVWGSDYAALTGSMYTILGNGKDTALAGIACEVT